MGKECIDCYYSEPSSGMAKYHCKKRKRIVGGFDAACSYFVSDDAKSCLDCYYSEADTRFFARNDAYICSRTNKKVSRDDIACSHFVED